MRAFLRRYRERSLTMDDLLGDRIFWRAAVPLLVPSFLGAIAIDSESAGGDIAVKWAFGILFLPIFLGLLVLAAHALPKKPSTLIKALRFFGAFSFAAAGSYASMGYPNLANALTGSSQPVLVSGLITEMKAESGRYAGRPHNITVRYNDREVMLTTTPQEFAQLKVGDVYSREMNLGGLGYYYTWGLAFWK